MEEKKVIVAVLNWGLGHASRCIPIIQKLLQQDYIPILASDGNALSFLQKEFPYLESILLPSYKINYGNHLKLNLILQIPRIYYAIKKENKNIDAYLKKNKNIVGIIADNRFGCYNKEIQSIYITHQLNVLSGLFTFFTSKIHQIFIKKFDECWVPDTSNSYLSGKLSLLKNKNIKVNYIGALSRFKKENLVKNINYLIILSGPEPNRTILEKKLIKEFLGKEKVVFVLGRIEKKQKKWKENGIIFYNYQLQKELNYTLNSAQVVICRSGYSTILDLAVLQKKAFFIPTHNQSEQEYLATFFKEKGIAPFCKENDFTFKQIQKIKDYKGFSFSKTEFNINLHSFFQSK